MTEWKQKYQRRLAEWEAAKRAPMPHPEVPKIEPDQVVMAPMRDGVGLHTEIHLPGGDGPWPLVLFRTPYPDPTYPFSLRPIGLFTEGGYAVALQSCRGTWKSEGIFPRRTGLV